MKQKNSAQVALYVFVASFLFSLAIFYIHPVAGTVIRFLFAQSPTGFVNFIAGMTSGGING